jgi:hypothetical protein
MFEKRVLRKIFGLKREAITEDKRRLYNEKLYGLGFSPNFIWVIMSRRLRWLGHVSDRGGEERCIQWFGGET